MKSVFVFILFILCITALQAQNITVTEDPAVTQMIDRHVAINKNTTTLKGWRVQILATTDRLRMERVKGSFQAKFPDVPVTWIHEKPWYKLRAGAFYTKLEAIRLLNRLKSYYEGAYTTEDKSIQPHELLGN